MIVWSDSSRLLMYMFEEFEQIMVVLFICYCIHQIYALWIRNELKVIDPNEHVLYSCIKKLNLKLNSNFISYYILYIICFFIVIVSA